MTTASPTRRSRESVRTTSQTIRHFLLLAGASFAVAGLVHADLLVEGYAHRQASIAESVIAAVLLAGFGLTWLWPAGTRPVGLAAQAFALLGTLVGVFTIAIGIGPRTAPDVAYHLAILAALVWGLVVTARSRADEPRASA